MGQARWFPQAGEKKRSSALNEKVTRKYNMDIQKRICGVGFQKRAAQELKQMREFATNERGTPDAMIHGSTKRSAISNMIFHFVQP